MNDEAIDQINDLEDRKQQLIAEARESAMSNITESLEILSELGLHYSLVAKPKAKAAPRATRAPSNRPCKICGFATSPPHDARHHRHQEEKRAFTPEELQKRGLTRVPDSTADPQPTENSS